MIQKNVIISTQMMDFHFDSIHLVAGYAHFSSIDTMNIFRRSQTSKR
jgi:hypothetical protein